LSNVAADLDEGAGGQAGLSQTYQGVCGLLVKIHEWRGDPLPAAVACRFHGPDGDLDFFALLDTASAYCMISAELASELGLTSPGRQGSDHVVRVRTARDGTVKGVLRRVSFSIPATQGTDVELSSTWFVSDDWHGPNVIGWTGCLETMAFGCRPAVTADDCDTFLFAAL